MVSYTRYWWCLPITRAKENKLASYDPLRLAQQLKGHGLSMADIATGVAIVMAESSFQTDALGGPNDNNTWDRGLWQLNSAYHDEAIAYDPVLATQRAVEVKGDGDWTPWSAYTNGAWRAHRKLGWMTVRAMVLREKLDEANRTENELLGHIDQLEEIIDEAMAVLSTAVSD